MTAEECLRYYGRVAESSNSVSGGVVKLLQKHYMTAGDDYSPVERAFATLR
ncbi:MAG: hypothetical protein M3R15_14315 [Acidobacteriota bacterium]|nr:hypothetical protein [Acidobacteriota bacterium]